MEALAAIADPTRRDLLALLARGEIAAGDLAAEFPVSRPAISRHLRVLREAGLVRSRTKGRRHLYALDPAPLRELDAWLEPYRDLWAQRLDALDTEIARGRRGGGPGDGGRRPRRRAHAPRPCPHLGRRPARRDQRGRRRPAAAGLPPLLARSG